MGLPLAKLEKLNSKYIGMSEGMSSAISSVSYIYIWTRGNARFWHFVLILYPFLSLGITYHADDEEKYLGQKRRKKYDLCMQIIYFSIYTLSDLGDLSNLIGSLSRTITGNISIYQISE